MDDPFDPWGEIPKSSRWLQSMREYLDRAGLLAALVGSGLALTGLLQVWIGFALLFFALGVLVWDILSSFALRAATKWLGTVALVLLVFIVLLRPMSRYSEMRTEHPVTTADLRAELARTFGSNQLSLTCEIIPLPVAYHGEIWFLESSFFKGLARMSAPPTKPDELWPFSKMDGGLGYRCTIQNFSTAPLLRISLSLPITVLSIVREKSGSWTAGDKIIKKETAQVIVPHPLGPQEGFTFYIGDTYNDRSVRIELPSHALIDRSEQERNVSVPLHVISGTGENTLWLLSTKPPSQ
jgi:hypothetical protein